MTSPAKIITVCLLYMPIYLAFSADAQWTPDPMCPWPGYDPVKYPYPGDCTKYWECFDGTKTEQSCPEGLEFNAPLQECDIPEIAKCNPDSTDTPGTRSTKSTTPTFTPDPMCPYPSEEQTYFPYTGDCTKYWTCFEGRKYLYNCPAGLYWHEEISECDYPENVPECGKDLTTNKRTAVSKLAGSESTSKSSYMAQNGAFTPDPLCPYPSNKITYFPFSGDCTKYLECYEGVKTEMNCPAGLYWHEKISECDYPENVPDCGQDVTTTSSTPSPTTTGSKSTSTSSSTTQDGGFTPDPLCPYPSNQITYFPFPGDCTKYLECYEGVKTEMNCPPGLYWHESISECDWPRNVDCKND